MVRQRVSASILWSTSSEIDRKSTRLNSTLSLHAVLPIYLAADKYHNGKPLPVVIEPQADGSTASVRIDPVVYQQRDRSEEHTSELHSFPPRRSSDLSRR